MELTVMNVHEKLLDAFYKVKRDVKTLRDLVRNQNETVVTVQNNQKALLVRIRKLETELMRVKAENNKPAPKPRVKVVEKVKVVKETVRVAKKREYVGAKTSMKLHDGDCPFAKNINRKNKALFKSKVKPFNLGYKACACLK